MFSRLVSSGRNPVPTSSRPCDATSEQGPPPLCRLGNTARDLKQRAFAGSFATNDADGVAVINAEANLSERGKRQRGCLRPRRTSRGLASGGTNKRGWCPNYQKIKSLLWRLPH